MANELDKFAIKEHRAGPSPVHRRCSATSEFCQEGVCHSLPLQIFAGSCPLPGWLARQGGHVDCLRLALRVDAHLEHNLSAHIEVAKLIANHEDIATILRLGLVA